MLKLRLQLSRVVTKKDERELSVYFRDHTSQLDRSNVNTEELDRVLCRSEMKDHLAKPNVTSLMGGKWQVQDWNIFRNEVVRAYYKRRLIFFNEIHRGVSTPLVFEIDLPGDEKDLSIKTVRQLARSVNRKVYVLQHIATLRYKKTSTDGWKPFKGVHLVVDAKVTREMGARMTHWFRLLAVQSGLPEDSVDGRYCSASGKLRDEIELRPPFNLKKLECYYCDGGTSPSKRFCQTCNGYGKVADRGSVYLSKAVVHPNGKVEILDRPESVDVFLHSSTVAQRDLEQKPSDLPTLPEVVAYYKNIQSVRQQKVRLDQRKRKSEYKESTQFKKKQKKGRFNARLALKEFPMGPFQRMLTPLIRAGYGRVILPTDKLSVVYNRRSKDVESIRCTLQHTYCATEKRNHKSNRARIMLNKEGELSMGCWGDVCRNGSDWHFITLDDYEDQVEELFDFISKQL